MDEKDKKDVKKEENTSEDSSDSKKTSDNVSEDVQNTQKEESSEKKGEESSEDNEQIAEELLSDKTSPKKEVKIKYDKFAEINEKAKLYDSFSPLLAKMKDNPDAAKKILGLDESKETIENRVARIEEEIKESKRQELKNALADAIGLWPDLKDRWSDIRSIVSSLEKQGISSRQAIQRAYFAVYPEEATKEKRLIEEQHAKEAFNRQGTFASSAGYRRVVTGEEDGTALSDEDMEFARVMNIDPKLYRKHAIFIKKFENL